jgi:monooxygenase
MEHVDVIVVGGGLSGIGAGCHLKRECPDRSFIILEGRSAIGGTWDLFRYPGIRSDSDMYTLGYAFKPWREAKAIADGSSILRYIEETAREHDVLSHVRLEHRVVSASFSSDRARWTVVVERGPNKERVELSCNFLYTCSGYYRYDAGHTPDFPGRERFQGRVVHPQHWTSDIDYTNKRVVVIGSGATAVTLVPSLAAKAAHVTMLQRSPTYVVSRPARDKLADRLREKLPARLAYGLTRAKNVALTTFFYQMSRRRPEQMKRLMVGGVKRQLGREFDVRTHFTPRYKPWDQRVCLVPDGDLFKAIRSGKASVVTDRIATFTERGIRLESGQELEADLIVTATGLELLPLGGIALTVDGAPVVLPEKFAYKGMMLSDVPNYALAIGYTNASWTLKADLTSEYVCRILNHMKRHGYQRVAPENHDPALRPIPWMDLTAGYVQRNLAVFPKQGSKRPWQLYQNYVRDLMLLRYARVDDGVMQFR